MGETLLRLEVWKPTRLPTCFHYQNQDESSRVTEIDNNKLYEQVYTWKLKEDPWADPAAKPIKEKLFDGFEVNLLPEKRSIRNLKIILNQLKTLLAQEQHRMWEDTRQTTYADDKMYRSQPLLLLFQHLDWICDIFQYVPGASVTLR